MPINYTISTVDAPEYKRLICGRANDISYLFDCIFQGNSIALFGERRIGKSSIMYIIRDIINRDIDSYEHLLIDDELKTQLGRLKCMMPRSQAVYLDLLALDKSDPESLVKLLQRRLQALNILFAPQKQKRLPKHQYGFDSQLALIDIFEGVEKTFNGDRLVVLVDEVEVLFDFKNGEQIFRNFRSVIQSCPRICIVFSGAEAWHKQIKDKTSPLVNNVQVFYLKAAAQYETETFLITRQLQEYFASTYNISHVVRTVIDWTSCKPLYVQVVCQIIVETRTTSNVLPHDWEDYVEGKVQEAVGPILDAFYMGRNLDPLAQKILVLLANKSRLSIEQMARMLGYSVKVVRDSVSELESLDKVRKESREYRIAGSLIERWGKQTQDIPAVRSPWPQRLRWLSAAAFLLLAAQIYLYAHPPLKTSSFNIPNGIISVRTPSSLEQDETGKASVLIQNVSATDTYSVTVSLVSSDIDYMYHESNRYTFSSIAPGETKFWEPDFVSRSATSRELFTSTILITQDTPKFSNIYPFTIERRGLALKKFGGLISILLIGLSSFLSKQELSRLVSSIAQVLNGKKDDTGSDADENP